MHTGRNFKRMTQNGQHWVEELRRERQGRLIGGKILFFEQIDSTNIMARAQALNGVPEGLVVLADAQAQGKGRLSRSWVSPPGVNLYLSIVLRPELSPEKIPQLTIVAGIAAAKALQKVSGLEIKIKWPNDLFVQGKKVAGILAEQEPLQKFVVLGIGVNINWEEAEIPPDLQATATSLYLAAGHKFSRADVAWAICENIEKEYVFFLKEGFSPRLREEWLSLSLVDQKWVIIKVKDQEFVGLALGLDENGALLLRTKEGEIKRFWAGEVSLRF